MSVRRDRRSGREVTVIEGDVQGADAVEELVRLVELVAQDQLVTLDISRLSGLDDKQRSEFLSTIGSTVEIIDL